MALNEYSIGYTSLEIIDEIKEKDESSIEDSSSDDNEGLNGEGAGDEVKHNENNIDSDNDKDDNNVYERNSYNSISLDDSYISETEDTAVHDNNQTTLKKSCTYNVNNNEIEHNKSKSHSTSSSSKNSGNIPSSFNVVNKSNTLIKPSKTMPPQQPQPQKELTPEYVDEEEIEGSNIIMKDQTNQVQWLSIDLFIKKIILDDFANINPELIDAFCSQFYAFFKVDYIIMKISTAFYYYRKKKLSSTKLMNLVLFMNKIISELNRTKLLSNDICTALILYELYSDIIRDPGLKATSTFEAQWILITKSPVLYNGDYAKHIQRNLNKDNNYSIQTKIANSNNNNDNTSDVNKNDNNNITVTPENKDSNVEQQQQQPKEEQTQQNENTESNSNDKNSDNNTTTTTQTNNESNNTNNVNNKDNDKTTFTDEHNNTNNVNNNTNSENVNIVNDNNINNTNDSNVNNTNENNVSNTNDNNTKTNDNTTTPTTNTNNENLNRANRINTTNALTISDNISTDKINKTQKRNDAFYVLEWEDEDIANELTFLSRLQLSVLQNNEFLSGKFMKKDKKVTSPTVVKISQHFDSLIMFVIQDILSYDHKPMRGKLIEKWINISYKCRTMNNFNDSMAIKQALTHFIIQKLKKSWKFVTKPALKLYDELNELYSCDGNYRNLRDELKKCEGTPYVPYLGILLRDINFFEEKAKYIKDKTLINFEKLMLVQTAMDTFYKYKSHTYNITQIDQLAFFTCLLPIEEEELEELGNNIEPEFKLYKKKKEEKRLTRMDELYFSNRFLNN